ncbi:MAG: hypothetical protein GOVbin1630_31 [Prokaryotic dsDNA virus sp.]|nr:MAG: hypothetical protein GOVbin1630_31 [Prokaryotic dsDNA virus sp.]|tara:strand:+ start:1301 stop:1504 length:204 start_codon:yes stop_codon:yes gene_type:complete
MAYIERDGGRTYIGGGSWSEQPWEYYIVTDDVTFVEDGGRIDCDNKADAIRKLKEYQDRIREQQRND